MSREGPVIIIDDDEDDRELIQNAVNAYWPRHALEMFENGRQALDYL